jgi:hypothetical protein
MGIFDKLKGDDKKKKSKADFSNVKAGGSSTAAPPEKKEVLRRWQPVAADLRGQQGHHQGP